MYAEALGVDPSLEALAQWVSWADSSRQAHNWGDTIYNLQQFWAAKAALSADDQAANMKDLVFLDATSHRVNAYLYMGQLATAEKSEIAGLGLKIQQEFSASSQEFAAAGYQMQADHDALHASQGQEWAAQTEAAYIDDSYMTALKDTVNADIEAAGSIIDAAGSALSLLKSPIVWVALAALAGLVLFRGNR